MSHINEEEKLVSRTEGAGGQACACVGTVWRDQAPWPWPAVLRSDSWNRAQRGFGENESGN